MGRAFVHHSGSFCHSPLQALNEPCTHEKQKAFRKVLTPLEMLFTFRKTVDPQWSHPCDEW